jgi:hypothetical protein
MIAFVAAGTAAAGARAAAPLKSVLAGPSLNATLYRSLGTLAYGDWSGMVGNSFTLMTGVGPNLALALARVTAVTVSGKRPASLRSQPFMLLFTGPVLPPGNRIYRIVHPTHGYLDTFFDAATSTGLTAQFN